MNHINAMDCSQPAAWPKFAGLRAAAVMSLLCVLPLLATGCPASHISSKIFHRNPQFVLDMGISKDELVTHLNENVSGNDTHPGLSGWKTHNAGVRLSGPVPFEFSTSIAVQAPRNLRILVSKPGGSQAVDVGSNEDLFWFWTFEQPEMVMCHHDDTKIAMQHLQVPIQIDPNWLMEVFGVMPINGSDYVIDRPSESDPLLDLVAIQSGSNGVSVEKIIRVNALTGQIDSHILRQLDGEVVAQAHLGDYRKMPNGSALPHSIRIALPQIDKQLKITLGDVEPNPPSFAHASTLWSMPTIQGARVLDIGKMSRYARRDVPPRDVVGPGERMSRDGFEEPGLVPLEGGIKLSAPVPLEIESTAAEFPVDADEPEWARTQTANKPSSSGGWQRSGYSAEAWQSSLAPHRQAQE